MAKVEFKRGDGVTHFFKMPVASWASGGKLIFTAKPAVDDDATDATAKIRRVFDDSVTANDGTNVTYTCYFPPSDTSGIAMSGDDKIDYLGEFQWVNAAGVPTTFPGNNKYLDVVLYADVGIRTS